MELKRKQIENILAWIGKSYPADLLPPIGIPIGIICDDFMISVAIFDGDKYHCSYNSEPKIGQEIKGVIAWRHIKQN